MLRKGITIKAHFYFICANKIKTYSIGRVFVLRSHEYQRMTNFIKSLSLAWLRVGDFTLILYI